MIEIASAHTFVIILFTTIFLILNIPPMYKNRFPFIAKVLWIWILISGIYVSFYPFPPYGELLKWDSNILQAAIDAKAIFEHSTKALLIALILPMTIILMNRIQAEQLLFALESLAMIESFLLITNGLGVFNPSSLGATFIAVIYPIMLFKPAVILDEQPIIKKRLPMAILLVTWTALPGIAIAVSGAATPIYMMMASITIYLILTRRFLAAMTFTCALIVGGILLQGHEFISPRGRFFAWELFMRWWIDNANHWFGTGLGTFWVLGPVIQPGDKDQFLYLHNEYLQILFELGWVGLILFLLLGIIMFLRSLSRPWLAATLVGASVGLSTQFLFRYPASALFFVLLIRIVFENWNESRKSWRE